MSAFGSSAINKSGKKLAPKVPAQRRRPATSASGQGTSLSAIVQPHPTALPTPSSTQETTTPRKSKEQAPQGGQDHLALVEPQSLIAAPDTPASNHIEPSDFGDRDENDNPISESTTENEHNQTRGLNSRTVHKIGEDTSQRLSKRRRIEPIVSTTSSSPNESVSGPSTRFRRANASDHGTSSAPQIDLAARKENAADATPSSATSGTRRSKRHAPDSARNQVQIPVAASNALTGPNNTVSISQQSHVQEHNTALLTKTRRRRGDAVGSTAVLSANPDPPSPSRPENAIDGPAATPVSKRRAPRNRGRKAQDADPSVRTRARRQLSHEAVTEIHSNTNIEANEDLQSTRELTQERDASEPVQVRKRKGTPDGAEDVEIDTSTMRMFDLCKNTKTGKKSKLEAEFQNIDWSEVARLRKQEEDLKRAGELNKESDNTEENRPNRQTDQGSAAGPRLKIVNGQITIDSSSLMVSTHRQADQIDEEIGNAVLETDLTKRINSRTWLNDTRRDPEERFRSTTKSNPWTDEETDLFYEALRMFGTDFFIISKMFPGRTRRHIKLKYVREERADLRRINAALGIESVPMDLTKYCEATGQDEESFKDPRLLEEELRAEDERQKADIERQKQEQEEAQRQKQDAAVAKDLFQKRGANGRQKKRRNLQSDTITEVEVNTVTD